MGGIVDSVTGLFGVEGGDSVDALQYNPYNVQSALGQAQFGGGSANLQLSPELQGLFGGLLGQAQPNTPSAMSLMGQTGGLQQTAQDVLSQAPRFQEKAQGLLGRAQTQFDLARDPQAALDFQRQVYGPELERQRLSQESRLLNQGLLGSTTGQLQQEATRTGQNQALLRGAQQQQQQAFQQGQGLLGQAVGLEQLGLGALGQGSQQELARQQFEGNLQQQARQQQLQSLQAALGVGQAPSQLGQFGANLGQGELDAQLGTQSLRNQAQQRQQDFFGGLVGTAADAGAFSGLGGAITSGIGGLFSDIRLKKNIKKIGDYTYTWDWNDKAVQVGADTYPTTGVIAQEIIDIVPEAVFEGKHGYLMVDYSKVA